MLSHFLRSTTSWHCQGPKQGCLQVTKGFGTESVQKKPSSEDSSSTTNEFLKSFGILLQEPKDAKIVGRWDWHLWQLCAALLPALGIVALAHIATLDMKNQEAILLKQREDKAGEESAAEAAKESDKQTRPPPTNGLHAELQAKVADMEKALQIMQMRQLMQQATQTGVILGPQGPSQAAFLGAAASSLSDNSIIERGQSPALIDSAKHASSAINQTTRTSEYITPAKQQPAVPAVHGLQDKQQADLPKEAHDPPTAVSAVRQYLHQKIQHAYIAAKSGLCGAEAVKEGAGQENTRDGSVNNDQ